MYKGCAKRSFLVKMKRFLFKKTYSKRFRCISIAFYIISATSSCPETYFKRKNDKMYIKFQPKNYFLFNQTLIPFTNRQFETIQQLENIRLAD